MENHKELIKRIHHKTDDCAMSHLFATGPVFCKLSYVWGYLESGGRPVEDTYWEIMSSCISLGTMRDKIRRKLDYSIARLLG